MKITEVFLNAVVITVLCLETVACPFDEIGTEDSSLPMAAILSWLIIQPPCTGSDCPCTGLANSSCPLFSCSSAPSPENRYPIVLLHGFLGFDDILGTGYFKDVKSTLENNNYQVCVTEVSPTQTVAYRANQLKTQIDSILLQTGASKVNLVGHSMGGLDARYLVSSMNYAHRVASVSTVGTPHRGSEFADVALGILPGDVTAAIAAFLDVFGTAYNKATTVSESDALRAVNNLTTDFAAGFNVNNPDITGVYYQSWAGRTGTALEVIAGSENDECGILCVSYGVMVLDGAGANDGLVSITSGQWGTYQGALDADHAEQIGHPAPLLNSSTFNHLVFYSNLAQGLVNGGY